jgi:predicted nuclease of predicted toxin-antitoxin system
VDEQPDEPKLRLLIDACLTPAAVLRLHEVFEGAVDVVHLDSVLAPATTDRDVLDWAQRERRAIVTANIRDFARLARLTAGHPGLLLVEDQAGRDAQISAVIRIVGAVLSRPESDIAGHVFVWRSAQGGRLAIRELP